MLALATFSGELLEVFDQPGLGLDSDARGDNLKSTRGALLVVATQVIHSLDAGIEAEIASLLEAPAPTCTRKLLHIRPHVLLSYYLY